jgi:coenzyme F420-reducing hydrogenase gamma subunit
MEKLKAALVTLTSCFGCSFEFLNLKKDLLKIFERIDFVNFKLIKEENVKTTYDIVFVEGAVSTKEEIEKIKDIRKHAKFLVALGACACNACVLTIKNYVKNAEKKVYDKNRYGSIPVKGIDVYIKVDYYLRGCPFSKHELSEFFKAWLVGKILREKKYAVCVECRKGDNDCLLDKGIICFGPIIRAGCNAICPINEYPCVGCRGLSPDANLDEFLSLLKTKFKLNKKLIKEMLKMYNLYEEVKEAESWKKLK